MAEKNEDVFDMTAFDGDFVFDDTFETNDPINDDDNKDKDKDKKDPKPDPNKGNGEDDNDNGGDSHDDGKEIVANQGNEGDGDDSGNDNADDPSQKLYSSLASALEEEGIISSLEDPVKDADGLFNIIKSEIKKNEFSDLNDTQKEYLEALRNGVPVEEYKQAKSFESQLDQIKEDDLKSEDGAELRKSIIAQDFINQGISEEKAMKLAGRSIELGEDIQDSVEALESIKTYTKTALKARIDKEKQNRIDAQKKAEADQKALRKSVMDTQEIIPDVKISEKQRKTIYDQMTKVVGKDDNGNPLNAVMKYRAENPQDFTIKMHYLFNLTNGFKDFDKLVKSTKSKAVNQLDDALKGNTFISSGQQSRDNMDYDLDDNMEIILDNI